MVAVAAVAEARSWDLLIQRPLPKIAVRLRCWHPTSMSCGGEENLEVIDVEICLLRVLEHEEQANMKLH